ncbi:hypothetical protein RUND412_004135 [Rhizina undulata]
MSLKATYTRFLSAPKTSALFPSDPSLNYITTTQSILSAESIVKHLTHEATQLKKKVEKVLSSVETGDTLALEVETEIEFVLSGGSFLPGMDDNFVTDQSIVLPIVHFVKFQDGLIKQIRLFWDQATVLKQLGIIGRNGRNWPIKDGREQCVLIANSANDSSNGTSSSNGFESTKPVDNRSHKEPAVEKTPPASPNCERTIRALEHTAELGNGEEEFDVNAKSPKIVRTIKVDPSKHTHFEFTESQKDVPSHTASIRMTGKNSTTSSWGFEDFASPSGPSRGVKMAHGRRANDDHFVIADESPVSRKVQKELPAARMTAVKNLNSQWDNESPEEETGGFFDKLGQEKQVRGIRIAGDGMGQNKDGFRVNVLGPKDRLKR